WSATTTSAGRAPRGRPRPRASPRGPWPRSSGRRGEPAEGGRAPGGGEGRALDGVDREDREARDVDWREAPSAGRTRREREDGVAVVHRVDRADRPGEAVVGDGGEVVGLLDGERRVGRDDRERRLLHR